MRCERFTIFDNCWQFFTIFYHFGDDEVKAKWSKQQQHCGRTCVANLKLDTVQIRQGGRWGGAPSYEVPSFLFWYSFISRQYFMKNFVNTRICVSLQSTWHFGLLYIVLFPFEKQMISAAITFPFHESKKYYTTDTYVRLKLPFKMFRWVDVCIEEEMWNQMGFSEW